jgi:hypothetical protein
MAGTAADWRLRQLFSCSSVLMYDLTFFRPGKQWILL